MRQYCCPSSVKGGKKRCRASAAVPRVGQKTQENAGGWRRDARLQSEKGVVRKGDKRRNRSILKHIEMLKNSCLHITVVCLGLLFGLYIYIYISYRIFYYLLQVSYLYHILVDYFRILDKYIRIPRKTHLLINSSLPRPGETVELNWSWLNLALAFK